MMSQSAEYGTMKLVEKDEDDDEDKASAAASGKRSTSATPTTGLFAGANSERGSVVKRKRAQPDDDDAERLAEPSQDDTA